MPTLGESSSTIKELSATLTEISQVQLEHWSGFKIVGDNIDKNFRRSFQRHDNKTISMHAFHIYAVKDRIDFSSYSDIAPATAQVDVTKLLIGETEIYKLNKNVTSLLSR